MAKVLVGATVSLDGYIADHNDDVGVLFDWYGNGEVEATYSDKDRVFRVSQASADYIDSLRDVRACVIGRRLFDITNGWHGVPAAGEHVFVVTHSPPADWDYAGTAPFTFVTSGVADAVSQARSFAGDGSVSVTAGSIGAQVLAEGLADEIHFNVVPVVFGGGRPFFGPGAQQLLENPRVIEGDRVTHLVYSVRRS